MEHCLRVKYGHRLLLLTRSTVEAQTFFRQRLQILQQEQVRHLECWLCSRDLNVITPAFTADLDEDGRLLGGSPKTAAERAWEQGWEDGQS